MAVRIAAGIWFAKGERPRESRQGSVEMTSKQVQGLSLA